MKKKWFFICLLAIAAFGFFYLHSEKEDADCSPDFDQTTLICRWKISEMANKGDHLAMVWYSGLLFSDGRIEESKVWIEKAAAIESNNEHILNSVMSLCSIRPDAIPPDVVLRWLEEGAKKNSELNYFLVDFFAKPNCSRNLASMEHATSAIRSLSDCHLFTIQTYVERAKETKFPIPKDARDLLRAKVDKCSRERSDMFGSQIDQSVETRILEALD